MGSPRPLGEGLGVRAYNFCQSTRLFCPTPHWTTGYETIARNDGEYGKIPKLDFLTSQMKGFLEEDFENCHRPVKSHRW